MAEERLAREASRSLSGRLPGARHRRGVWRAALQADPGLRRVRLPGEPLRELCPARLRELVAQGALPGRVRCRAREQPTNGLLLAVDPRPGRSAPRRAARADR